MRTIQMQLEDQCPGVENNQDHLGTLVLGVPELLGDLGSSRYDSAIVRQFPPLLLSSRA